MSCTGALAAVARPGEAGATVDRVDRPDVLLLTSDPVLRDGVLRLVAVAGRGAETGPDPAAARGAWADSATVVLGADLLAFARESVLPRRTSVLVVAAHEPEPEVWAGALALGAEAVLVLPDDEGELVALLAAPVRPAVRALTVGVVGGSGGAGASVLSGALALSCARRGSSVVLIDADPGSGGLDLLLAAEDEPGARWPDLRAVTGSLAPDALLRALPSVHGVHLLSAARDPDPPGGSRPLGPVVEAARAGADVVLLDLPRGRPEVLDLLVPRCDRLLVVVTADVRGAASARALLPSLAATAAPQLVVRRRARGGCDVDELAAWIGAPVAAELDDDPRATARIDLGDPPGASPRSRLARTCDGLAAALEAAA